MENLDKGEGVRLKFLHIDDPFESADDKGLRLASPYKKAFATSRSPVIYERGSTPINRVYVDITNVLFPNNTIIGLEDFFTKKKDLYEESLSKGKDAKPEKYCHKIRNEFNVALSVLCVGVFVAAHDLINDYTQFVEFSMLFDQDHGGSGFYICKLRTEDIEEIFNESVKSCDVLKAYILFFSDYINPASKLFLSDYSKNIDMRKDIEEEGLLLQ